MTPQQLKEKRLSLGLTQQALADELGKTRDAVAKWEGGKVPIPKILSLALLAITYLQNQAVK